MFQSPDDILLQWLADQGRILLTHDVRTMTGFVFDRVNNGKPVPGVFVVHQNTPIGAAIDALEVAIVVGTPEDFANQVWFIPFR